MERVRERPKLMLIMVLQLLDRVFIDSQINEKDANNVEKGRFLFFK